MDDKFYERLTAIEHTLLRNTISLEVHMKRSDQLEKAVEILAEELKPIRTHVDRFKFVGWIAMWTFGSSGFIMLLLKKLGL